MPTTSAPRSARRRHPARPVAAVALAAALLAACSGAAGDEALPDAELVPLDGGSATSTAEVLAVGTPVVVNIWASWCTPCIAEMPAFDEVHQALGDEVAIVGITDDREEPARELAEETAVTYPLYRDPERTLLPDLGVAGLPATYFVDADGTIVDSHQGPLDAEELTETIESLWGTS